jgi:uncharacterized protein YqgQ
MRRVKAEIKALTKQLHRNNNYLESLQTKMKIYQELFVAGLISRSGFREYMKHASEKIEMLDDEFSELYSLLCSLEEQETKTKKNESLS